MIMIMIMTIYYSDKAIIGTKSGVGGLRPPTWLLLLVLVTIISNIGYYYQ